MSTPPVSPTALLLFFCVLLNACSQDSVELMQDYHQRVANVLEMEALQPEAVGYPPSPGARALRLQLTPLSISLLDFLKLWNCELNQVLGERNNPMGKFAAPSQRMRTTRDILLHGNECVKTLQSGQPALASELSQLLQVKHDERMLSWWNAWVSSSEWQQFTRRGADPLSWQPERAEPARLAALQALDYALLQGRQWQRGEFDYRQSDMEFHQQQMALSELIGRWRRSQAQLTTISYSTAVLLRYRTGEKPLCPMSKATTRARYLDNVFHKFYAGRFQPYLATVERSGTALLQRLSELAMLAPAPAAFTGWLRQLTEEKRRFDAAHHEHVQAWQGILRSCGLMPGISSTAQVN